MASAAGAEAQGPVSEQGGENEGVSTEHPREVQREARLPVRERSGDSSRKRSAPGEHPAPADQKSRAAARLVGPRWPVTARATFPMVCFGLDVSRSPFAHWVELDLVPRSIVDVRLPHSVREWTRGEVRRLLCPQITLRQILQRGAIDPASWWRVRLETPRVASSDAWLLPGDRRARRCLLMEVEPVTAHELQMLAPWRSMLRLCACLCVRAESASRS